MKVRNHENTKFHIKKIYIDDDPEYNGYRVSLVVNNKYIEYIHRGKYIDDILEEIKIYLYLMVNQADDEYIKI